MVKSMVIRIEDFQKLGRQDLLGKVDSKRLLSRHLMVGVFPYLYQ